MSSTEHSSNYDMENSSSTALPVSTILQASLEINNVSDSQVRKVTHTFSITIFSLLPSYYVKELFVVVDNNEVFDKRITSSDYNNNVLMKQRDFINQNNKTKTNI